MRKTGLCIAVPLLVISLIASGGCLTGSSAGQAAPVATAVTVQGTTQGTMVNIPGLDRQYPAYVTAPGGTGPYPGIVLIHSFNGLEPGYLTLVDRLAARGYVVIAPQWQTFNASPSDEVVGSLISSGVAFLKARPDVDASRLGLTGFCAGGRYTMLFLPQMKEFKAGVAWYGFPYSSGFANETRPIDHLDSLTVPMLMIHGSADQASPVTDIYRYAVALNGSQKYFELKVYEGQPHGFEVQNGVANDSDIGKDAFREMVAFFNRTLKGTGE